MRTSFKLLFIIAFCLRGLLLPGRDVTTNARISAPAMYTAGSVLLVKYDKFAALPYPTTGSSVTVNSFKGLIEFGIDENKKIYHSGNFTSFITFTYTVKDFSLGISPPQTQSLAINYDPALPYKPQAFLNIDNATSIQITAFKIKTFLNYPSSPTLTANPNDLYLEGSITADETIALSYSTALPASSQFSFEALTASSYTTDLQAQWDYVPGAENYELEWLYLDDYPSTTYTASPVSTSSLTYDFDHDATRIVTSNQYYNIPMVYERGWVIYRVRGVGFAAANSNARLEGTWSAAATGTLSSFISTYSNCAMYVQTAHESDLINWASTRTYAEDGKSGIGISYEDGLMKNRQSVAKLNTEDKTIAQSTLYDWQGRPAVSVLPAPITDNYLSYKTNLNRTSVGTVTAQYDKNVFDNLSLATSSCALGGYTMSPTLSSGAGNYYSTSNANQDAQQALTPDAKGYPFVQVDYYPDQTGRIRRQSLPGNTHYLGSGKEQKFFYAQPTQEELVRLFGTEVGLAMMYEKHISIDPNGQASVSYVDDEGRTVATALSGANPANLVPLADATSSLTAQSYSTGIANNNNNAADYVLEADQSFFAIAGETEQIAYNVSVSQYTDACAPSLCLDCIYELEVRVTDDCNNDIIDGDPLTAGNQPVTKILGRYDPNATPQFTTACTGTVAALSFSLSPNPTSFTVSTTGTYHVTKRLKLSTLPLTQYASDYITASANSGTACVTTLQQLQNDALSNLDLTSCSSDCASCSTSVVSYTAANPGVLSASQIQDLLDRCQLKCDMTDPCREGENLLLGYFKPGGYFAQVDGSQPDLTPTPSSSSVYSLSIFNSMNVLNTSTVLNTGGGTVWYASPPGSYGSYTTFDPATSTSVPPSSLSVQNYVGTYNDSYAKPWLKWHPEYCKLQFYCDPMISSIVSYSSALNNISSFNEACQQGFLYPVATATAWGHAPTSTLCPSCTTVSNVYIPLTSSSTLTPGFSSSDAASALSSLSSSLTALTFSATTANIYQMAIGAATNADPTALSGATLFGGDNCYNDIEWTMYKRFYLMLINNLLSDLQQTWISSKWNTSTDGGCMSPTNMANLSGYVQVYPELKVESIPAIASFLASNTTTASMSSAVTSSMSSQCASYCSGYVNNWMSNLTPCSISPSDWTGIKTALEAVCAAGCDVNDPFGAANTNTAIVITVGSGTASVSSFQGVLTAFGYTASPTCNAYLITAPLPKGHSYNSTTTATLDACGCDAILSAHMTYTNLVAATPSYACTNPEAAYLASVLGTPIDNPGAYVCACQGATTGTVVPHSYTFSLVPANTLQSLALPNNLACQNCIPCSSFTNPAVVSSYSAAFGSTPTSSVDPVLLANFYNSALNMNNTASDWQAFISDCANASTTGGIKEQSTTEVNGVTTLWNILFTNGFLLPNTYTLNTTNGAAFFSSSLWTSASGYTPTLTNTVTVTTSIASNILTAFITNSVSYSCSYTITYSLTLPTFSPGISASFSDTKGACQTVLGAPSLSLSAYVTTLSFLSSPTTLTTYTLTGNNTCFPMLKTPNFAGAQGCTPYLCSKSLSLNTPTNSCIATLINTALNSAQTQYDHDLTARVDTFLKHYKNYCYGSTSENLQRGYTLNEYHYTLYYYDRAGNLVHTVPPASVSVLTGTTLTSAVTTVTNITGSGVYPAHSLNQSTGINSYLSHYEYNTFDAPVVQVTPDGGETDYLYDWAGRLTASRNAKQKNDNSWSYTLYDQFGRIKEVGVALLSGTVTITDALVKDPAAWATFMSGVNRQEVTESFYDAPFSSTISAQFAGGTQNNLRNRVSATTYEWTFDNDSLTYDHATFYSYDDHGNATEIVQHKPALATYTANNNQYKKIEYEYDLVSGNVNTVSYQKNLPDQFYHKYYYDKDNRLHEVQTSHDGKVYVKDAAYFYYTHGPLARTELGQQQVQGTDYAYTIQGWVKGVNSTVLQQNTDIGKDANASSTYTYMSAYAGIHQNFAMDGTGYNLNYFTGDYSPIAANSATFLASVSNLTASTSGFTLSADAPDLYNGNIASMVTSIYDIGVGDADLGLVKPQLTANKYDQLHRVTNVKAYSSLQVNDPSNVRHSEAINLAGNVWSVPTATNYAGIYEMALTYDKIGNIQTLQRAGNANYSSGWSRKGMDNLTYNYGTATLSVPSLSQTISVNSRLGYVTDPTSSGNYSTDIDNQSSGNYTYNPIGSLAADASEEIQTISWTDAHKVQSIRRTSSSVKPDIFYDYDEFGRRITKTVSGKSAPGVIDPSNIIKTHYVLDADGNTMALYKEQVVPMTSTVLTCEAHDLYGSSRLGVKNEAIDMLTVPSTTNVLEDDLGNKDYELTNHLGNVITTISDRKKSIDGVYTYTGNAAGNYTFDGGTFNSILAGNGYYVQTSAPDGTVDSYVPDIHSVTDYYAFGMPMPNRNTSLSSYRYGMNGQEKEDEVLGYTGVTSAEYWMYDSRSGRRWENDPLVKDHQSPYASFDNNPIYYADASGLEAEGTGVGGKAKGKKVAVNDGATKDMKVSKAKAKAKAKRKEKVTPEKVEPIKVTSISNGAGSEGELKYSTPSAPPEEAKIMQAPVKTGQIFDIISSVHAPRSVNFGRVVFDVSNQFYSAYNWIVNREPYDITGKNIGYQRAVSNSVLTFASVASGPLGRAIGGLSASEAVFNGTRGFRYMTEGELKAIKNTGLLRGGRPGETFFTKDLYKSASKAQQRLALPETPTYRVEFEIMNKPKMLLNGTKVKATRDWIGGGSEFMTKDNVQVDLINWQKLNH